MVEVIIESFNYNTGIGEGRTKNSGRSVILLLNNYKTGNETPKSNPGDSVWCVLSGSDGNKLTASEIYNRPDERMERFLAEFREHFANLKGGPMNGEMLIRSDGKVCRITEVHCDKLQPCGNDFFAGRDFSVGYSGSLEQSIPISTLELTGELREARFWTWRNFSPEAHNGFTFEAKVRVWRET
ncbi:hypothetical protein [Bdellovibrio sp. BCCA]|uniref:hypothetical protein n=1 Tax=Bdellovibrio sp. BCCA TaxID=3136281 RepID=UPI0030F350F2